MMRLIKRVYLVPGEDDELGQDSFFSFKSLDVNNSGKLLDSIEQEITLLDC
jgi:hypothetical protein